MHAARLSRPRKINGGNTTRQGQLQRRGGEYPETSERPPDLTIGAGAGWSFLVYGRSGAGQGRIRVRSPGAATPSCFPIFCLAGSLAVPLTRWCWCCASLCGFAQRRTGAAVWQPKGSQHLTPGTARGHSFVHPRCAHTPQGAQLRAAARACMIAVLFASSRVAQSVGCVCWADCSAEPCRRST